MNRIYIIGALGTGKTTLGCKLAEKLNCRHFDSDDYYHYQTDPPYQKARSPRDRVQLLNADLKKHTSWIMSGGAGVWDPPPSVTYSLVIFLFLPSENRLQRLRLRESDLYGSRILNGGDMEGTHKEFLDWTVGYDSGSAEGTNTLPVHEAFLKNLTCPVIRFDKEISTTQKVEIILKQIETQTK